MVSRADEPQNGARRLMVDFAAWLDEPPESEADFYARGLIVLDTNVLLDLYRVNPETRGQVIRALGAVGDRLWVPHQAAIEFSRNRKQAVIGRQASFKQARDALRDAAANAVNVLERALGGFEELRRRNGENRIWDPAAAGLDHDSLQQRLSGVMEPAIAKLDEMESAHDLRPSDMQSADEVLRQVDELLAGRIGAAYSPSQLRSLVDEAAAYRFPNNVPPGDRDSQKETSLRAAGDFLLWRQTIDRVNRLPDSGRLVLLITNEEKPDWWELDKRGKPVKPRPELVQEMRDDANAHLRLTSLANFPTSAGTYLTRGISDEAVDELRRAATSMTAEYRRSCSDYYGTGPLLLLSLSTAQFEKVVMSLMESMGYGVKTLSEVISSTQSGRIGHVWRSRTAAT